MLLFLTVTVTVKKRRTESVRLPLGGALLGDRVQALADLLRVLAEVVQARQLREALEPEHALEQRRRAVADRARDVVAARLRDQSALDQVRHRGVGGHAADTRDVRP